MGLAVKQFFSMRPQLSFRFSVDINVCDELPDGIDYLNVCVKNVKVTTGEADITKGAMYYGNGYFTIPIFNVADKTLEISFNETDNLDVLKWLDTIQEEQAHQIPPEIKIRITEYDETMTEEISRILYSCYLKEYSEPAFSRSGSVSFSTIDASFVIVEESDEFGASKLMKGYKPLVNMDGYRPTIDGDRSSGVGWGDPFVAVKGQPQIKDDSDQGVALRDREAAEREKYASPTGHDVDTRTEVTGANRSNGIGLGSPEIENVSLTTNDGNVEIEVPELENNNGETDETIGTTPKPVDFDLNKTEELPSNSMELEQNPETPNEPQEKLEAESLPDDNGPVASSEKLIKETPLLKQKTLEDVYGVLSKDARKDFENFTKKLKQNKKYNGFDENKSAYTIFDIKNNKIYYIENGVLQYEAFAYTSTGEANESEGESPEGVYAYTKAWGGTHQSRKANIENQINQKEISELNEKMIQSSDTSITFVSVAKDSNKTLKVAKDKNGKDKNDHAEFVNFQNYTKNLIDEGNGDAIYEWKNKKTGKMEKTNREVDAGIHSHAIWWYGREDNTNKNRVKELTDYETERKDFDERRARGEVSDEEIKEQEKKDKAMRQKLKDTEATQGCTVMSPQALAWQAEWLKKHPAESVFEFKVGGTSEFNKTNNN